MREVVPDTQQAAAGPIASQLRIGSQVASGRLQVLEALGRGGMGVVYQAFDTTRRCTVALKTMHRNDAVAIYALKNEFRALCDVHHPNLVRLFELYCEDENTWFFTMELVRGERFDRWVRPAGKLDERRLRHALVQLLDGIAAVHAAGKLHRDIKPSNVLVTDDGHVVVLDFGLVTEPNLHAVGETLTDPGIVGTPAYLAPELVLGSRPSAATDLYAVGVMLFEALTGQLPFEGTALELLIAKQQSAHSWPPTARRALPPDLVTLCDMLLARNPGLRPDMATLLAHFSHEPRFSIIPPSAAPSPLTAAELIGRDPELAQLRAAYAASQSLQPVVMFVSGESGIGKTALCNMLVEDLARDGQAVVLRGRCNEHESVPFKALDSLVDDLSRYLRRLRPEQAAALMPRDAAALTTLFPTLTRVDVLAQAPARPATDPHEQLRRAFAAFHELLARLRDRAPLIIHIDDLQWTDRDSTLLLRHLLLHPEPVPALMIFSHRSEPGELLDIVRDAAQTNRALQVEQIVLEPLPEDASSRLVLRWLAGAHASHAPEMTARIEREAHGNPFLIGEFARFVALQGEIDSENLSLHVVLDARLATMSVPARKLLMLLTLAGQPMATELLLTAAGATHADVDVAQSAHLVRSVGKAKLEFYHDRIRERLRESVEPDEERSLYAELARVCAEQPDVEADMQCAYLEGAGNLAQAAACAAAAADQAAAALAFDHAARLYEKALDLGAFDRSVGLRLTQALAQALENAGRSVEAAAVYQRAAVLADGDDNLDLRRRAAAQLLAAGHVNEGLAALESVCADMGLKLPTGSKLGNVSLALALGTLRIAGPSPMSAPARALKRSAEERRHALRLDTLQTAYIGLESYSQVGAAPLALEYLREAQRRGDTRHLVWALGSLGMVVRSRALYPELLARMDAIATQDGRAELRGLVSGLRGFVASRAGDHGEARAWFARALACYADCVGMQWQIDIVHVYDQQSAAIRGEYTELARTTPAWIDEAFQHGRAWTGAMLTGFWGMGAWLAFDDAAGFRRQLERAHSHWGNYGAALTADRATYGLHRAEVMLSLYERTPLIGYELLARRANAPMKSTHRRDHAFLRSLCCVAALGAARAGQLREVDLVALREEARPTDEVRRAPQIRANAHLIDAAIAIDESRLDTAVRELRVAERLFESTSAPVMVAATRRRLGSLIGGAEGRALVTAAEAFLLSLHVRDLDAFNEMLCPGCAI